MERSGSVKPPGGLGLGNLDFLDQLGVQPPEQNKAYGGTLNETVTATEATPNDIGNKPADSSAAVAGRPISGLSSGEPGVTGTSNVEGKYDRQADKQTCVSTFHPAVWLVSVLNCCR